MHAQYLERLCQVGDLLSAAIILNRPHFGMLFNLSDKMEMTLHPPHRANPGHLRLAYDTYTYTWAPAPAGTYHSLHVTYVH